MLNFKNNIDISYKRQTTFIHNSDYDSNSIMTRRNTENLSFEKVVQIKI